ncbi:MAG: class I SAM-dependent methyltransferase [Thermodesulfobacteriota bacterium]
MINKLRYLSRILICPSCHGYLAEAEGKRICATCDRRFGTNQHGFVEFVLNPALYEIDTTTEDYAKDQESNGFRFYTEYLRPFLLREPFKRILDVGCGIGKGISSLLSEGYDAYGVDLPSLSRFWAQAGNDPNHFFCCDASHLPFPDDYFDVVYSLGVIEHIGTKIGHYTLSPNYREVRQQYANELIRITKPDGRILISCPNKSFPIDIQHSPNDGLSPENRMRAYLFGKTGMNIHRTWGEYYLLSYSETRSMFCDNGGARLLRPLPLRGYFGFGRFGRGFLKPFGGLAEFYINNLPGTLRSCFLNPYMLAEITK